MSVFREYAKYYNLLYQDKDYAKEVEYIHRLIKSFKSDAVSLLNIGCGTGEHDRLLRAFGYKIKGIDFSDAMIAMAKPFEEKGILEFEVADARTFRSQEKYDVVLSLFHVVNYQNSNKSLIDFFTTAHDHLKEGGIFVFDSWYGPAVLLDKPYIKSKEIENNEMRINRKTVPEIDYNHNIAHINFEIEITDKLTNRITNLKEKHSMRYLFYPEIEIITTMLGFEIIKFNKWMGDESPTEKTWYVLFCLLKK